MKQIVGASVLILLAGIAFLVASNGDDAAPDKPISPPDAGVKLVGVAHGGYQLGVPEAWFRSDKTARNLPGQGIYYEGPEQNGFRPNILFWPPPSGGMRSLDSYYRDQLAKLQNPIDPVEVVGNRDATVGRSMPARKVTYTRNERVRTGDNRAILVSTIDWYFRAPDGCGLLRVNCNSTTFLEWRPVFERIAAGLRPLPR